MIDGLRRADWSVVPGRRWEVEHFCRLWHYSRSASNSATYCHVLEHVATMRHDGGSIWIPPTRQAAVAVAGERWEGVLCLSRLVVAPEAPGNAASFLLGGSMRLIDRDRWPILLTYADTRLGHTGAIYRATNWEYDGEVAAGDMWISEHGEQRGRKRNSRSRTVAEMEASGFVRAPTAPKLRFVHRITP
jgi:hypothetical protein